MLSSPPKNVPRKREAAGADDDDDDRLYAVVVRSVEKCRSPEFAQPFLFPTTTVRVFLFSLVKEKRKITYFNMNIKSAAVAVVQIYLLLYCGLLVIFRNITVFVQ